MKPSNYVISINKSPNMKKENNGKIQYKEASFFKKKKKDICV